MKRLKRHILRNFRDLPPRGLYSARRVIVLFLPFLIFTLICAIVFTYLSKQAEISSHQDKQLHSVNLQLQITKEHIKEARQDLRLLAKQPSAAGIWSTHETESQHHRSDMQTSLLVFMKHRQNYDQIRFLDIHGNETIRVNYNNNTPYLVPEAELQNKAKRYYFIEARKLGPDEIYYSPMDLNVENGVIEKPHKPVIRLVTPVQDHQGTIRGYIIINYLAQSLLDRFNDLDHPDEAGAIMLNSQGYWLRAMNHHDAFTFMHPDQEHISFANRHPDIWHRIQKNHDTQFITKDALYASTTLSPFDETPMIKHQSANQSSAQKGQWKIVSVVPMNTLNSMKPTRLLMITGIVVLTNLMALAIAVRIAKTEGRLFKVAAELKENEAYQRQLAEKARKATQAKSVFLASISHEIRTPINGILGNAEQLSESNLNQEQARQLHTIDTCGHQLLSLIDEVLDFSRIEANKMKIEHELFDLYTLISDVGDMLGLKAARKNLELIFDIDPLLPKEYIGDPNRIKQILINLTNNAIKYTPTGFIHIKISRLKQKESTVYIKCSVKDSGIGIAEDQLDHLFHEFTQVEQGNASNQGGVGLGLAISKKLVQLMHGSIHVKSTEGKGSEFWFEIPLQIKESQYSIHDKSPLKEKHVLLLEDSPRQRQAIIDCLTHAGATVYAYPITHKAFMHYQDSRAQQMPPIDYAIIDDKTIQASDDFTFDDLVKEAIKCTLGRKPRILLTRHLGMNEQACVCTKYSSDKVIIRELKKPIYYYRLVDALAQMDNTRQVPVISQDTSSSQAIMNLRVLLVEDNESNQMVAKYYLSKKLNCDVHIVDNGYDALEQMKTRHYDLVFMDCNLPGMDGYQTTKAIREGESGVLQPEIPIIAMTANAMDADREACLNAGMDDYISKPFKSEYLAEVIRRTINQHALKNT